MVKGDTANICYPLEFVRKRFNLSDIVSNTAQVMQEGIDYLISNDFPERVPTTPLRQTINDVFQNDIVPLMNAKGFDISWKKMLKHGNYWYENRTELVDNIVRVHIIREWCKNKQIYRFDNDFASILPNKSSVVMSTQKFESLPCNTFYVDTSGLTGDIVGAFVHVRMIQDSLVIYLEILISNLVVFAQVLACTSVNSNSIITFNLLDESETVSLPDDRGGFHETLQINKVVNLVINTIAYISSEKPDICESELTKHTYHKPNSTALPKNKFSEVQAWDIGIRYGQELRDLHKASEYKSTTVKRKVSDYNAESKVKKVYRPHWVRGAYQVYWTGPGRKVPVVKFRQGFVRGGKIAADVVIHS